MQAQLFSHIQILSYKMSYNKQNLLKSLGPGILFASTAIGVSHLVQSTRAGASFGFALLWAVLLANLFKYPFFEYGSRYANITGKSIIYGYKQIGRWMLWLYFIITLGSMFFVTSAVSFVTAGFLQNLFGVPVNSFSILNTSSILISICVLVLSLGKYNALDSLIKIIGVVLLISTLTAFTLTLFHGPVGQAKDFVIPDIWNVSGIAFLIALMGWMPTAVDLSAWNSLWTIERMKQTGYKPKLKETLFDFNFGYIISALLAICFITLGAYIMYGSGKSMPNGSAAFANEVIHLYTETIGEWSYIIIAASAFSIMFGTSIAVLDGYARSIKRSIELLFFKEEEQDMWQNDRRFFIGALIILALGTMAIIFHYHEQPSGFKLLVDLATTLSFLIAPLIAIVNFRIVMNKKVMKEGIPPKWLQALSYCGIIFLSIFCLLFIYAKIYL